MNSKIIDYFIEITKIPHCSKDTSKLRDFLVEFAKKRDYNVELDSDNILISKGSPKIILQAHYDMVCMGKAPNIQTFIDGDLLKAKESSLGADNGIAIAMMMELMDKGIECEYLLTNDEEIGLIGAKALNFKFKSNYMLNLDSEDEGEVYIGCAGGEDIKASYNYESNQIVNHNIYELSINNLDGGHSGVDIDKNIPSAIKLLVEYLKSIDFKLISFDGGERRNSIPSNAKAVIQTNNKLLKDELINIKKINGEFKTIDNTLIDILDKIHHGVVDYDNEFNIPNSSINLAIVHSDYKSSTIEITTRAMSSKSLEAVSNSAIKILQEYNYRYQIEDNYPAWQPKIDNFSRLVDKRMRDEFGESKFKAIHAGLECGVISNLYPHLSFASIGPTIRYPHSKNEELKISSVNKIFQVVLNVINDI
ncbi:Aminoacyl-histidine dipeptidase (Peptidase D) [hydrothermal vent metagenome]|uniref:Aminoacyl-histidine dipeptidase (Peptidase D) n=1 Tax=hydrothermal vent metagenome TaxID=652676 RepID=A0A1W1EJ71_9ZZZZ